MLGGSSSSSAPSDHFHNATLAAEHANSTNKRKRRPAGTPDPDAEVVSLSPKTLLESDRYVCEICNQGFQRDQNLQMHRRRHKVPWKLLKRENPVVRKRVFVCPEPTCLHHDPCHALGDLVGIKKHFRRKHSNHKQWVCDKCSKAYAVQSDYKAHLKTCGTRGHSCDCGRVFSRVESFIEHQDACNMGRHPAGPPSHPPHQYQQCLSRAASSSSPSNDTTTNNTTPLAVPWTTPGLTIRNQPHMESNNNNNNLHNLDLQLAVSPKGNDQENHSTQLQLSIGSSDFGEKSSNNINLETNSMTSSTVKEQASEQLRLAMAEKVYAEETRREAKRQVELAEREYANAKRIRQQAQTELDKAQALKEHAMKQISSTLLQITCHACKQQFHATTPTTTTTTSTTAFLAAQAEDQNSSLAESQSQVEDNNLQ
ncbi:protein indeterminate-domain 14-like [Silene latifolia]|uniref:protein indeterminate-domain 14-like n=1 Tax=Silene latifolia TaxID=37657 RepID=UPI003D7802EA